jgi:lipopolysaccharide biosynthesis glycosyltransferase
MKTAVVTLCIGKDFEGIAKFTHPTIKQYANRIGADFIVINSIKIGTERPHFEKFQLYSLLDKYNRIFYVDTDVIISPNCPNVFEIVPESMFGAFIESNFQKRDNLIEFIQKKLGRIHWKKTYFNSGVMVFSRKHKHIFNRYNGLNTAWGDTGEQTQLNYNLQKYQIPIFDIGIKFNNILNFNTEGRFKSYILHYAGNNSYRKHRLEIIKRDACIMKLPAFLRMPANNLLSLILKYKKKITRVCAYLRRAVCKNEPHNPTCI